MKYIRTKDEKVYELKETQNGEKYLVRTGEAIPLWNTEAYEIIAQADTIEELCDNFIRVEDGRITTVFSKDKVKRWLFKKWAMDDRKAVYCGMIGLNEVALLNRNGEFDLI